MDNRQLNSVLHHLHQLKGGTQTAALTDGQLLGRFVSRHDDAAFELLVRRHGPLVWSVCRRILGNHADAEDAFQAVFLVLVRRAASLERTCPLAAWLHTVACRAALRARETAARRRRHERAAERAETCSETGAEARDLRRVLDEELDRLPDKYRIPLVLCYLEGLTQEETARQLGWPLGTLKSRVLRGREQLRGRLARRGLAPCGALPAVPALPLAPPSVVSAALNAAVQFAGGSAGSASAHAVALTEGVLKTMTMSKLKTAAALLLAATFLAAGAGGFALYARTTEPGAAPVAAADDKDSKQPDKDPKPPDKADKPAQFGEKLEALWADLASDEQAKAWRAAFALAAAPKDATALFQARLKPMTIDAERVAKLIRDMDDDNFDVREAAYTELKTAGELVVPQLRKALENKPTAEVRRRIDEILSQVKSPSPSTVRNARAVAVLEALGGDDAKKLLEATAKGQADALPTRAAQNALERLKGKPAEWQAHWDGLASPDEALALRAALAAVAAPKEALPFFKERLQKGLPGSGADAPDEKVIEKLVAGLADDKFDVREKAARDLIALGRAAETQIAHQLAKAKSGQLDIEVAKRLSDVLAKIQTGSGAGGSGERLILVLAHIDTAESRDMIEVVRKGQIQSTKTAKSPDGRLLVDTQNDLVRMTDVATGKLLWITKAGPGPICVAFSPDGKCVAAGTGGGDVTVIDAATGKQLLLLRAHKAGVTGVSFSGDGKQLKSADTGGTVHVWDLATGQKLN
jgi:RNA polymerase sigma factor (sigma-70 family)